MLKTLLLILGLFHAPALIAAEKPNVVLILSDDAGFADFSHKNSTEMKTPHISSLIKSGVLFETAYVSAPVCSPSRAGLLTGRYQNRFGFQYNLRPDKNEHHKDLGITLKQKTIADHFKAAGYATSAIGKWHVGYLGDYHPNKRGFDEFFGLLGGHRSYFRDKKVDDFKKLQRNGVLIDEQDEKYVTDWLGDEAVSFIQRNQTNPFFLYLSFTAVHAPMEADDKRLSQHTDVKNKNRRKLAAMTQALDDNVGKVMNCLKQLKLQKNTLVIFLNDNGGATNNYSTNLPLRGHKGQLYEGGLRVPMVMSWPGNIKPSTSYKHPVISLDILPSSLAAVNVKQIPGSAKLDGVNLFPYLSGENKERPHQNLYWKFYTKGMRSGDWKYIINKQGKFLFNLAEDPNEKLNLLKQQPAKVEELSKLLLNWEEQMPEPWK